MVTSRPSPIALFNTQKSTGLCLKEPTTPITAYSGKRPGTIYFLSVFGQSESIVAIV